MTEGVLPAPFAVIDGDKPPAPIGMECKIARGTAILWVPFLTLEQIERRRSAIETFSAVPQIYRWGPTEISAFFEVLLDAIAPNHPSTTVEWLKPRLNTVEVFMLIFAMTGQPPVVAA